MNGPALLTPVEFEIIDTLWKAGRPLSVSAVRTVLLERRSVAYTTVMTLLEKMTRKGVVTRRRRGKAYLYSPLVERSQVQACLLQRFAEHFFDGRSEAIKNFIEEVAAASNARVCSEPVEDVDVTLL